MFFALSKIFWIVANPGNLFVLGLVIGTLGLFTPWRRLRALAKGLLGLTAGAALAISMLPVGAWLLAPLEDRFPHLTEPPQRVDGVILLGGAINLQRAVGRDGVSLNKYAERVTGFVELARRYPDAKLVFSGGSGLLFDQEHSEADYADRLLQALGVAPGRVVFERESRNTHENAANSAVIVQPRAGEVWLLVTSAFHIPRAVGAFRRVGWPVTAYPVNYFTAPEDAWRLDFDFAKGLSRTSIAVREWIGLLVYRWLDWIDTLFPGPAAG